jgi:NodT family efflux transporter outer membrane factor (OMF) lipoprotein
VRVVLAVAVLAYSLCACTVGPDYIRATAPVPAKFKELKGWKAATPIDGFDRGRWWSVYKDPRLNELIARVEVSNQTVKAAAAAYEQARAMIREAQASLFPTLDTGYSFTRSFQGANVTTPGVLPQQTSIYSTIYNPQADSSWSPDVWGKVRRQIESNIATAQASAADLANATLSAQAMLAIAYFDLMTADSLRAVFARTIADHKRTLEIARNQYNTGTATRADVTAAETQLLNVQAAETGIGLQRAQFEHAVAVLTGRPPAELSLAVRQLPNNIPNIPVTIPSQLLERRPDVAAAERQMQAQNALIGVAVAAYYPNITLSASFGFSGHIPLPFKVSNVLWSLGADATETAFDGGLRGAQVDAARAVYWQSVADYRQTVLTAFQQVEDQLAAIRILTQQLKVVNQAVSSARQTVETYTDQFRTGIASFTTVLVAQATLLASEQSALTIRQNLFVASVSLIEALGGGWDASLLPSADALASGLSLLPQLPACPPDRNGC